MNSQPIRLTAIGAVAVALLGLGWFSIAMTVQGSGADTPSNNDGTTAHEQLDAAVNKTLACIEDAGIETNAEDGEGKRITRLSYSVPPQDGDPAKGPAPGATAAVQECMEEHYTDAAHAHGHARSAPNEAALEELVGDLEACVAGGGVPGVELTNVTLVEYDMASVEPPVIDADKFEAYSECAVALETETGYLSPQPKFAQ